MTSLLQCDGLDVKDDSATVSLRAEEAFEFVIDAELGRHDLLRDVADGPGPDLEADLAGDAELEGLRFVLQADVERRKACGREPERSTLDDPRRQREPVRQADAS
jgi:hypothetical protein